MDGPLSVEFLRTLDEMKLGKSRKEAFSDLRDRVPSEAFQSIPKRYERTSPSGSVGDWNGESVACPDPANTGTEAAGGKRTGHEGTGQNDDPHGVIYVSDSVCCFVGTHRGAIGDKVVIKRQSPRIFRGL
jgi:hypothetical protein